MGIQFPKPYVIETSKRMWAYDWYRPVLICACYRIWLYNSRVVDRSCYGSHPNNYVLTSHYDFTEEELDFISSTSTLLRAGIN